MAVQPIPPGYRTVTPYLVVDDVVRLLDFIKRAFSAVETYRSPGPGGAIMHAEARIGDSMVMMGAAREGNPALRSMLYLYVEKVDDVYKQAIAAGGQSIHEPEDQFYGDRCGGLSDPFGNQWWIGTHVEDVSHEEIVRRMKTAQH